MQTRKTGERSRVNACPEPRGRWRRDPFARVAQALIEQTEGGSGERTPLESIGNHVRTRSGVSTSAPRREPLL